MSDERPPDEITNVGMAPIEPRRPAPPTGPSPVPVSFVVRGEAANALRALIATGLYGTNVSECAERLCCERLRKVTRPRQ